MSALGTRHVHLIGGHAKVGNLVVGVVVAHGVERHVAERRVGTPGLPLLAVAGLDVDPLVALEIGAAVGALLVRDDHDERVVEPMTAKLGGGHDALLRGLCCLKNFSAATLALRVLSA